MALDDVKEFILPVVCVPMEFSVEDAEPDDAIVHLAQSLVVPFDFAGIHQGLDVDEFLGFELDIQVDRIGGFVGHVKLLV